MKSETMLIVGALAIAAGLVLVPRRGRASVGVAGKQLARVGAGDGSTVWGGAASAQSREQLARETGPDWTGP